MKFILQKRIQIMNSNHKLSLIFTCFYFKGPILSNGYNVKKGTPFIKD